MARARNIKPGFWTNEHIVELDPWARLLYIGLWAVADREGRLEDRPKRIKMEVFPADVVDVDALLTSIEAEGLIRRYSSNGENLIWIPGFKEHQNPHKNEKCSELPPHPEDVIETLPERSSNGASDPADSLNPDTGYLKPDSGGSASAETEAPAPATKPSEPDSAKPKPQKRATRISPTWSVSDGLRSWAHNAGFTDQDIGQEEPKFRDYWLSKGEPRKDWDAGFRYWMQNAKGYGHLLAKPSPPTTEPKGYSRDPDEADRQLQRDLEALRRQATSPEGRVA